MQQTKKSALKVQLMQMILVLSLQIFYEYKRLTRWSGLELNADKTENLNLNCNEKDLISFNYNDKSFSINAVEKIKICGICSNIDEEYQLNVVEKIKTLSYKI